MSLDTLLAWAQPLLVSGSEVRSEVSAIGLVPQRMKVCFTPWVY